MSHPSCTIASTGGGSPSRHEAPVRQRGVQRHGVFSDEGCSGMRKFTCGAARAKGVALEQWVPAGRRLVLVDVENLVGGSSASAEVVRAGQAAFMSAVPHLENDVWVWACGPTMFKVAAGVLPHRVILGRGLDGADQALLEYLRPDVVVGRYSAVVLGSGDGRAFTPAVRALEVQGVPTDVVAPERSTAWSLRACARSYTGLAVAAESFALAA